MKPVVNYVYSKTIVQSILDKNIERKFWVRLPQKITKSQYPIVMFFTGQGEMLMIFIIIQLKLRI